MKNDTYFEYYKIEKGDTLYKIGKMYNVNPALLASINGFNEADYIYPGQVLLIPSTNYGYYITKDGDTLSDVAKTLNITQEDLINYNKSLYLLSGQMIVKNKK